MSEYKCPNCGSKTIEAKVVAWVDPNSDEVVSDQSISASDECQCRDCDHSFKLAEAEEKELIKQEILFLSNEELDTQNLIVGVMSGMGYDIPDDAEITYDYFRGGFSVSAMRPDNMECHYLRPYPKEEVA